MTDHRPPDLPEALWARVDAHQADAPTEALEALVEALVQWAEGRHPDSLEDLLDGLRSRGAYDVSLGVLEAAWNSDLPPERMGRVVEDWIGTVKFGLDDHNGAETVAQHIAKGAHRLGMAFVADLGHLLLGWDMYTVADGLIEKAAQAMPGDLSIQFNWGVVQKMREDWAGAKASFEQILRLRDDQAARWNLGIACTALGDWPGARAAWTGLGMQLPPGEGDFAGVEGDISAVRLSFTGPNGERRYEVVWGKRLGPARVRLRTIPRFCTTAAYGDLLLVDGVREGETDLDGEQVPIFPVLATLEQAHADVLVYRQSNYEPGAAERVQQLALQLNQEGWPAANWSEMLSVDGLHLVVAVETHRNAAEADARVQALSEEADLQWATTNPYDS